MRIPPNSKCFKASSYDGSEYWVSPGDMVRVPIAEPGAWRRLIALAAVDEWLLDPEHIKTGGCDDWMRQNRLDDEANEWREWGGVEY